MILVTGGSGLLGRELSREFSARNWGFSGPTHEEFDLCSDLSVHRYMTKHRPAIVVNLAALTNVDLCEDRPDVADAINAEAVGRLARYCEKYKSKLIHVSTDYVFDGTKTTPYTEEDATSPCNEYGRSKLRGETYALEYGGIVIRMQWLFGMARANFIDYIVQAVKDGTQMQVLTNQFSCPSYTGWLAYYMADIAHKLKTPGIYHLVHDDSVSRYDCAKFIVDGMWAEASDVLIPTPEIKGWKAVRPLYTVMSNQKLKTTMGIDNLGSWESDIRTYIEKKHHLRLYDIR